MKRIVPALVAGLALIGAFAFTLREQAQIDPAKADAQLLAEVMKIKAIDHHAHPIKFVREGEAEDHDDDELSGCEISEFPLPVPLRFDNPVYLEAWKKLYGYKYDDMSEAHIGELIALKQQLMKEKGEAYPAWVLDQLGIETMIANRMAMGAGLKAPRFRFVAFIDALLFPLDNAGAKQINPDLKTIYTALDAQEKNFMAQVGVKSRPAMLDEYLSKVVTPTLEKLKSEKGLGVKFAAAYMRSLQFDRVAKATASRNYAKYANGGVPEATAYKALQDFLFRYMAAECGRLQLAVHIHVGAGIGAYFNYTWTHPLLLESVFNDPTLAKTNFVMIHGGWPFAKEATGMLYKPNVYADFSCQTFITYPRQLSEVLRQWLEAVPEKVTFGTDASRFAPFIGWEEVGYLSNKTGREALALALTGMMHDGEITREHALELARMALHDNAAKLYGMETGKLSLQN